MVLSEEKKEELLSWFRSVGDIKKLESKLKYYEISEELNDSINLVVQEYRTKEFWEHEPPF